MSSPAEKIDIVVGDFPADAALFRMHGVRTLFMGQGQTFTRAVDNVLNVLPGITREAAERMIREQCPEFKDLDDMLGLNAPAPPSVERPPVDLKDDVATEKLPPAGKRRRKAVVVAALLPALAASWALGRYTNIVDDAPVHAKASAPDVTPDAAGTKVENAPFTDDKFDYFSGASKIECNPVSALEAECTDADGMVMSTKAATGPDSTIFTFSYGKEQIGLRIFYDADYARTWARQDGSQELYQDMKVHGRYVLWGTDQARIAEYMKLLQQADKDAGPNVMGGSTPLPPRLAALTLGTLGLNSQEVHQIIAQPAVATSDAPSMVAARLVLGLVDATPVYGGPGGDDIVALAIGIERPPAATGGGVVLVTTPEPPAQTTTPPPVQTTTPSTPTAPSTPTTTPTSTPSTPSTPTTPPTPPTDTTTTPPAQTTPPPVETTPPPTADPTPSQPEGTTPPPVETTPPPVETTPPPTADPTPSQPEGTTPPPADTTPPPSADPVPSEPDGTATPPDEETPPPVTDTPVEETPAPPVEETPAPVETPAEGATPPGQDTNSESANPPGQEQKATDDEGQADADDLLILPSAWTVPAAA
ncbi:hypothetical protein [Streptomyces sp. NPDC001068]|uniref:hypothetical protein n=1 Tax=Streptomyces sp. NPDC001068 TaxID=3364544 RepID=UPI0036B563B2